MGYHRRPRLGCSRPRHIRSHGPGGVRNRAVPAWLATLGLILAVTVFAPRAFAATFPDAPTLLSVAADQSQATLTWSPPTSGGTAVVAGYVASVSPRATATVDTHVPVGPVADGAQISPDGSTAYVMTGGAITLVNLAAGATAPIPLPGFPSSESLSADGSRLYVSLRDLCQVAVIDTTARMVLTRFAVTGCQPMSGISGSFGFGVAVGPDQKSLWVTVPATNTVDVYSLNGAPRATYKVGIGPTGNGAGPTSVSFSPDGRAYVSDRDSGSISVLATATGKPIALVQLTTGSQQSTSGPFSTSLSPDGRHLYATNTAQGTLWVIDTTTPGYPVASVPVGAGAYQATASPDGKSVYVTNTIDGTVSVLNADSNGVVQTLTVDSPAGGLFGGSGGPQGGGIALTSDGVNAIVVNNLSGTITKVSTGDHACGTTVTNPDGSLKCTIANLKRGTRYDFSVAARYAAGLGSFSNTITAVAGHAPGAPTALSAAPGDSRVVLSWSAPADDGGAGITGYTITVGPASSGSPTQSPTTTVTASSSATPAPTPTTVPTCTPSNGGYVVSGTTFCVVTTLTNGTGYNFTVTASNAAGTSPPTPVVTATPRSVPGAPTSVSAAPADRSAAVSWAAPASDGGAAITRYLATATPRGAASPTGSWPLIPGVSDILLSPDGHTAYVVSRGLVTSGSDSRIAVIDTTTGATEWISIPGIPGREAISRDGSLLFVTTFLGCDIKVVDTAARQVLRVITVDACSSNHPLGLAVSPDQTKLWVTLQTNRIGVYDIATGDLVGYVATGDEPYAVTFSPDGLLAYVTEHSGTMTVIQTTTLVRLTNFSLSATATPASGPYQATVSPDGTRVYVPNSSSGSLAIVDGSATPPRLLTTVQISSSGYGAAVAPDGNTVYLDNPVDNTMAVLDARTSQVTQILSLGAPAPAPYRGSGGPDGGGIALSLDGQQAFVVQNLDGSIATLSTGAHTCWSAPTASGQGCELVGLTNGTDYDVAVAATNAAGAGPLSTTTRVTVGTPPGIPGSVLLAAADATIAVAWTAPDPVSAPPISSYTVTLAPADGTCQVTGTTALCTGLTNGTSYSVTVSAINAIGPSTPSPPVSTIPYTNPTPATIETVIPGDGQTSVEWSAPTNDGGVPITRYSMQTLPNDGLCTVDAAGLGRTAVCSGLSNGVIYALTVTATNRSGGTSTSEPVPVTPRTVPGAPTELAAAVGDTSISVTWSPPLTDGGAPVTGYAITASPDQGTCTLSGRAASCTGMTNGTTYTIAITAANAAGSGAGATVSASPRTTPTAPRNVTATPGNATATVSWVAPSSDGGATITSYQVTSTPGAQTCTTSGTLSCSVAGLTNGLNYSFTVSATNIAGTSASSSPSTQISPRTVPSAPTNVSASAGNTSVTLSWSAPASNGGAAIIGYTATSTPGSATCSTSGALLCTVTGLANGTSYRFTVTASNVAGNSIPSSASVAVTPAGPPAAPTSVAATAKKHIITATWRAPSSTGGFKISGYTVRVYTTSTGGTLVTTCSTSVTATAPPALTCSTPVVKAGTYYLSVTATNAASLTSPPSSPRVLIKA